MPLTWNDCGTISWSVAPSNPSLTSSLQSNKQGKVGLLKLFLRQTQPFYYLESTKEEGNKDLNSNNTSR